MTFVLGFNPHHVPDISPLTGAPFSNADLFLLSITKVSNGETRSTSNASCSPVELFSTRHPAGKGPVIVITGNDIAVPALYNVMELPAPPAVMLYTSGYTRGYVRPPVEIPDTPTGPPVMVLTASYLNGSPHNKIVENLSDPSLPKY